MGRGSGRVRLAVVAGVLGGGHVRGGGFAQVATAIEQ